MWCRIQRRRQPPVTVNDVAGRADDEAGLKINLRKIGIYLVNVPREKEVVSLEKNANNVYGRLR